jgi:hypothetical protein
MCWERYGVALCMCSIMTTVTICIAGCEGAVADMDGRSDVIRCSAVQRSHPRNECIVT